MIKKFLTLHVCLLLLISCSDKSDRLVKVNTVKVELKRDDGSSKINEFLEFSHFVPLQTGNDILIGEINKIQIIHNKIYILDWKQGAVFIFNADGSFVSKIDKKGRAGGEYLYLSDFEVISDGSIFLNDPIQGKIYVYDESGNLKYQMKNARKTWSFKLLDNGCIAYNMANGSGDEDGKREEYNYVCISDSGKVIHKGLPFNKVLTGNKFFYGSCRSFFCQYDDTIYMSSILNDTIYKVSQATGAVSPYLAFDFNTRRPAVDDSPKTVMDYVNSLNEENPTTPHNFYHFNNGNLIIYRYEHKPYIIITSSEGHILYSAPTGADKNGIKLSYIHPYIDSDNTGYIINPVTSTRIISWIDDYKKNGKERTLLNEIGICIEENSNPVLIFYKWIYPDY